MGGEGIGRDGHEWSATAPRSSSSFWTARETPSRHLLHLRVPPVAGKIFEKRRQYARQNDIGGPGRRVSPLIRLLLSRMRPTRVRTAKNRHCTPFNVQQVRNLPETTVQCEFSLGSLGSIKTKVAEPASSRPHWSSAEGFAAGIAWHHQRLGEPMVSLESFGKFRTMLQQMDFEFQAWCSAQVQIDCQLDLGLNIVRLAKSRAGVASRCYIYSHACAR